MTYFSSTNSLEWIDLEFEEFTTQNITLPLKQYKYLNKFFKYNNILDVYEQTKKLKTEELAHIFWQRYRSDEHKSSDELIDELKNKLRRIEQEQKSKIFIFIHLIIFSFNFVG